MPKPAAPSAPAPTSAPEGEIRVPAATGDVAGPTDMDTLFALQDKTLAKPAAQQNGHVPKKDDAPAPKAKKDRAGEIFEKTQKKAKELEKPAVDKKEEPFEGDFPDFDASQFLDPSPSDEPDPEPEPNEDPEPEPDADPDVSKETNLKNLRQIASRFKTEKSTLEAKVAELETQLQSRPDNKGLQDKITELSDRVKTLEPYELVFALHNNPAFKKKFVEGSQSLISEMTQIAEDYDVEKEAVNELLTATNRKQIDEILEELFSSSSARNDLKTLKQKYDGLQRERREWEKKPNEILTKVRSDEAQTEAEKNQRRDLHLNSVLEEGWERALSSLDKLPKEQKIYELVEIPGKKDHNEKVARPTLNQARNLMQAGLEHIEKMIRNQAVPDAAFVTWFANLCQQSAATQMINHVRWGIHDRYQKLQTEKTKQNGYSNPPLNTPSRSAPTKPSGDQKKKDGRARAAEIFSEVVSEN